MARSRFPVEVLTPEGNVFEGEIEMISTRTTVGSIGILAHHTPLLAMLDPAELRLYKSDSEIVRYAQGEGYLQMVNNRCLVLVEEAIAPQDLDAGHLRERVEQARAEFERAADGSEEARRAQRELKRYSTFEKIAAGA